VVEWRVASGEQQVGLVVNGHLHFLNPSTTVMRIAASIILVASAPLGALAAPNPIFTSLRSLVHQASELAGFDLGLLSHAVQHVVEGQQQHIKQWIHDGHAMMEQAGVVCKSP
jgi:hypothetical protein